MQPDATVTLDTLHLVFSAFGLVQKIATFEKGQGFQALVQYSDPETAEQVGCLHSPRLLMPIILFTSARSVFGPFLLLFRLQYYILRLSVSDFASVCRITSGVRILESQCICHVLSVPPFS